MALRKQNKRENIIFSTFIIVTTIASFLPFLKQANDVSFFADEFRMQYFLLSGLIFVVTLFKKRFKASVLALFLAVLNLSIIASHVEIFAKQNTSKVADVNFMFHRVSNEDRDDSIIFESLKKQTSDVMVFLNASNDLVRKIKVGFPSYFVAQKGNCYKNNNCLILSKFEAKRSGMVNLSEKNSKIIWASYANKGSLFTIIAFDEGKFSRFYENKNKDLEILIDFVKSRDEPVILMGGFSSVPWSKRIRSLEVDAGFFAKGGLNPNWPAAFPWPLRLPMDYILTHPGIGIAELRTQKEKGLEYRSLVGKIFASN